MRPHRPGPVEDHGSGSRTRADDPAPVPPSPLPSPRALQEVATQLKQQLGCAPVFLPPDVRERYYKGAASLPLFSSLGAARRLLLRRGGLRRGRPQHKAPAAPSAAPPAKRGPTRQHTPYPAHHAPAPARLLQAAAVAVVPLHPADGALVRGALQPGAVAGVRESKQGAGARALPRPRQPAPRAVPAPRPRGGSGLRLQPRLGGGASATSAPCHTLGWRPGSLDPALMRPSLPSIPPPPPPTGVHREGRGGVRDRRRLRLDPRLPPARDALAAAEAIQQDPVRPTRGPRRQGGGGRGAAARAAPPTAGPAVQR